MLIVELFIFWINVEYEIKLIISIIKIQISLHISKTYQVKITKTFFAYKRIVRGTLFRLKS